MNNLTRLRAAVGPGGADTSDYDLNPEVVLPEGRKLRPAAVLIGFSEGQTGLELWLTKRSSKLKHHPGQISFPGGKVDEGDKGPAATALREAREEIGLPEDVVEVLGALPPHETVTGFEVTPVLAYIQRPFVVTPEAGEVEEVFRVPFDHIVDPSRFIIERRRWRGTWRHFYTIPYGPYYIWGATARMLRALSDRL